MRSDRRSPWVCQQAEDMTPAERQAQCYPAQMPEPDWALNWSLAGVAGMMFWLGLFALIYVALPR